MIRKFRELSITSQNLSNRTLLVQVRNLLLAPIIYAMFIPLLFLDICVFLYQHIYFRLIGISIVPRKTYFVIDRHRLSYLNGVQKINCVYCGYANGLASYTKEIIARTEEYWCPIKHAAPIQDPHSKYDSFLEYGASEDFQKHVERVDHLIGKR